MVTNCPAKGWLRTHACMPGCAAQLNSTIAGFMVYLRDLESGQEERIHADPLIPDDWEPGGLGLLAHPNAPRLVLRLPIA